MNTDIRLIAERYQITTHMQRVGETDYYSALDTTTQKSVTLRTIDVSETGAVGIGLEHLAQDKLRRKMDNEKRLIDKLNHSGVLEILDIGFDDPIYFHVYPPFVFHNLRMEIVQNGRLPLPMILNAMQEVADTLSALHQNEIIHCDVSAETILLLDNHTKVIEFTIANYKQMEGSVPGNPPYMSPEAIGGAKPAVTHDIWSLGVTMYYTITGELPFGDIALPREVGAPRLFQKIFTESRKPMTDYRDDLPEKFIHLIDGMLEKDPTKRIGSMQEVSKAIKVLM